MKVFLMFNGHDFDIGQKPPANATELIQDLELQTIFGAMAGDDKFILGVVQNAILNAARNDVDVIAYRQRVLTDCLNNKDLVRQIYNLSVEAIERERKSLYYSFRDSPSSLLTRSIGILDICIDVLHKLRHFATYYASSFNSQGFERLFQMLRHELSDDYFEAMMSRLRELKFRNGTLMSANLGIGNKGVNYVLRRSSENSGNWLTSFFAKEKGYTIHLHPRDEAGAEALSHLRDRGLSLAAGALGRSADHILSFFRMLRVELGFYMGCIALHDKLTEMNAPVCLPQPKGLGGRPAFTCRGLYDVCLCLSMKKIVIGNDIMADDERLVIVTGANQGGKSTFLRSVGVAQLMMQAGMFVGAQELHMNVVDGVFTHYKREEDASMKSGKFDEELKRMSRLVDNVTRHALFLFNESFASTNEREGSEIGKEITLGLLNCGVKVFFVTHLYEFTRMIQDAKVGGTIFLRAERRADGSRTFKLTKGDPLNTAYGEDLYNQIFAEGDAILEPGELAAESKRVVT